MASDGQVMTQQAPLVVAVLGAESTGKTTLVEQLSQALQDLGHPTAVVPEVLREFCEARGRTPQAHEQRDLAAAQIQRIEAAKQMASVVLADTTALMTAVYSELIFQDPSLYPLAVEAHRTVDLTLLTAVDLPWVSDGIQRDGEHVRAPVDALIRRALLDAGIGPFGDQRAGRPPFAVRFGCGSTCFVGGTGSCIGQAAQAMALGVRQV
jgi:nicotinamide riboside kinase